jgi:hypothetical protein
MWYQGSRARVTIAVKNKWEAEWMKAWFYCKVPVHVCPQGGESVHVLHSHMSVLELLMEPPINRPDSDSRDVAFVKAASAIGGRDAVEEYLACGLYPLSASISFEGVTEGVTPVLWVKLPLPKFHAVRSDE